MSSSGHLYVGTSGFAYSAWRGSLYTLQTRPEEMLSAYAEHFGAVEIDASFHRFPSEAVLSEWARRTPETFRFSLKVHRAITYDRKPKDQARMLSDFVRRCTALGPRMGVFLLLFPPYRSLDDSFMTQLLQGLPQGMRAACLFRHGSWYNQGSADLLYRRGLSYCVVDGDYYPAAEVDPKGPFAYLRLQAHDYSQDELAAWHQRLEPLLAAGKDAYVFFANPETAPELARRFSDLVVRANHQLGESANVRTGSPGLSRRARAEAASPIP